jgi:hypothetical protein
VRNVADATRLPVTAYVGTTIWAQFHVDLIGSDVAMTGEPEDVPALARVAMPDVEQHGYRAYPLVDHIADKVAATFDRYGDTEAPSTRYKDLVDLVAIVIEASVKAEAQLAALASETKRRRTRFPQRFVVPMRDLWEQGYAAEAGRSLLPVARTLDDALAIVTRSSTRFSTAQRVGNGTRGQAAGSPDSLLDADRLGTVKINSNPVLQAAIIEEIRRVCGITPATAGAEDGEEDEAAADIRESRTPSADEAIEELELETTQ